ncbi:hypothetical protein RJ640_007955 [Escallonia rubra]|uniref:Uncharacterized protein n=1 Tax=Escallonia rubra TaxID=112253 RepID=A0AA88U6W7_9ASTE|nr:hypothetical protein RJ640_007955 [Escallonia rubra]
MVSSSSSLGPPLDPWLLPLQANSKASDKLRHHSKTRINFQKIGFTRKPEHIGSIRSFSAYSYTSATCAQVLQKSVLPFAASIAVLLWSGPATAGFMSGSTGIESVPGPELPQIDFLNRFNEANQKKYAENDARFRDSPLLKRLLEQSKLNKEKNKQQILDKYCIRGAEWGVGDCSAEGMTQEERDNFIAMLKKKAGVE